MEYLSKLRILLIEDDPEFQSKVRAILSSVGTITCASTLKAARALIHREPFDLCLLDYQLPDGLGLELLVELKRFPDHGPVIFISGNSDKTIISRCLNLGAVDYIPKTSQYETDIFTRIPLAIKRSQNLRRYSEIVERYRKAFRFEIIGDSLPIKKLKEQVNNLAGERINSIIIVGPNGSGKELVARKLNALEGQNRPFVAVNCLSITEASFESEFFGYEKSAFTSAQQAKLGYVELAHGGDLFLDEITELPPVCQAKLVRFLTQMEYIPVGGNRPRSASVRILSSSSKHLQEALADGEITKDLMYLIADHCIEVPSLGERKEDIPTLANYFLSANTNQEYRFSEEVFTFLLHHTWPGNVRELEQAVTNAFLNAKLRKSRTIEFPDFSRLQTSHSVKALVPRNKVDVNKEKYHEFMYLVEKLYWNEALSLFDENASRMARESGIGLSTINNKIKEFKLRNDLAGTT